MKRRAEFLVEKRDGRLEWLRASKLCRSVHLALLQERIDEPWRAMDIATTVLAALRLRAVRAGTREDAPLRSTDLADAVQQVLVANGMRLAAHAYGRVRSERARRRAALQVQGLPGDRGAGSEPLPDTGGLSTGRFEA